MKKTILALVLAAVVFGVLVWLARPSAKNENKVELAKSNRILAVEESDFYDFGTISMAAGKVKHQFKVKNTGTDPVNIEKVYTSCMCTTASITIPSGQFGPFGMPGHAGIPRLNQKINPNEEAVVEAVFDPAAHGPAGVGMIQRSVIIENNAGEPVELQFKATVKP